MLWRVRLEGFSKISAAPRPVERATERRDRRVGDSCEHGVELVGQSDR